MTGEGGRFDALRDRAAVLSRTRFALASRRRIRRALLPAWAAAPKAPGRCTCHGASPRPSRTSVVFCAAGVQPAAQRWRHLEHRGSQRRAGQAQQRVADAGDPHHQPWCFDAAGHAAAPAALRLARQQCARHVPRLVEQRRLLKRFRRGNKQLQVAEIAVTQAVPAAEAVRGCSPMRRSTLRQAPDRRAGGADPAAPARRPARRDTTPT